MVSKMENAPLTAFTCIWLDMEKVEIGERKDADLRGARKALWRDSDSVPAVGNRFFRWRIT